MLSTKNKVVLRCVEAPDMEKLDLILNNQDKVCEIMNPSSYAGEHAFNFSQLQKYYDSANNGVIKVSYKQINKRPRLFAIGGLSMQNFPKEIRASIAKDLYFDIDMVNAHPVILEFLCRTDLDFNPVYLNKRDEIIFELIKLNPDYTYDDIKKAFLALINGGPARFDKLKIFKWMVDLKIEIINIHDKFSEKYPDLLQEIKVIRVEKGDDFNHKAALMNHILCDFENDVLNTMISFLQKTKTIKNDFVCCFDGIMIPKSSTDDIHLLIDLLVKQIKKCHGIDILLKQKEMISFDENIFANRCENITDDDYPDTNDEPESESKLATDD